MQIIGGVEQVIIPVFKNKIIETRIDTGAARSAISARDIRISGKKVYFKPFDLEQEWVCLFYEKKNLKCSMGKEQRYHIYLSFLMNKILHTEMFGLSDRGHMNQPMLLGRSFLNNKFLINPAKSYMLGEVA